MGLFGFCGRRCHCSSGTDIAHTPAAAPAAAGGLLFVAARAAAAAAAGGGA